MMERAEVIHRIMKDNIPIWSQPTQKLLETLMDCDGNIYETAQRLHTSSYIISMHIKWQKELENGFQVVTDKVMGKALGNIIESIKKGNIEDSKWYIENHDKCQAPSKWHISGTSEGVEGND